MSNPSSTSVVALRDSNGGNGVFVPRNSFETFVGGAEKTSHPTPMPAPKTTMATTATITTETPFAPRIASAGGAPPPAAMPGANACHYLNVTGHEKCWNGQRTRLQCGLRHGPRGEQRVV